MRRRSRQLSAITGPGRLEYFLPASIADAIGGKGNYAFCIDSDSLMRQILLKGATARMKASRASSDAGRISNLLKYGYDPSTVEREAKKREASAKRQSKSGDALVDLGHQVQAEVAKLRSKGVTGVIPVCINRASGKRGSELPRYFRRANAIHERFHAGVRRVEADNGVQTGECYRKLDTLTEPYVTGSSLRYFALINYASSRPKFATEELLARVEEVRSACKTKRASKDCADTKAQILKHLRPADAAAFEALVAGIDKDYGTPLNVARAAVRTCKVP